MSKTPAEKLRLMLQQDKCHPMPCCWDGLSARVIEDAGFDFTFMSGFAVSAGRAGLPDTGLLSFGEMLDQGRNICSATSIPVIGDGDTGYGNAMNIRRTVEMYARAGFAAIMIEDQIHPKRCGHTKGRQVVDRNEAISRIKAGVDARNEGADILILARTDALGVMGIDEALWRAEAFSRAGADILFVEAPGSIEELAIIPEKIPGIHMANMLEGGTTPILPPGELHKLGYNIVAYPLTLLSASIKAMRSALEGLQAGKDLTGELLDFADLRKAVGFDDYYEMEQRYALADRQDHKD